MPSETQSTGSATVSIETVSHFLRQLAHDLHNDLNAMDLAATYIDEIVEDESVKEELAKQRETIHSMSKALHALSARLQPPVPGKITLPASDLVLGIRERLTQINAISAGVTEWVCDVGNHQVDVDFEMICSAIIEIFKNSRLYGGLESAPSFSATIESGNLLMRFSEKKESPSVPIARLGCDPFIVIKRRTYGLGLYYAARIAEAHGGGLQARYDSERGLFIVDFVIRVMAEKEIDIGKNES